MDSIIKVENLYKIYNSTEVEVRALNGVTIEIKRGEFVAVMGPSGSGKSTLFNILGCLDRPTMGSYMMEKKDISGLSEAEVAAIRNDKIGFVFQNFNLLPKATAIENVELPLVFSKNKTSNKAKRELARMALYKVGLEGRDNHYPSQLSGGEQQRVAIARAIINDPLVILADEPTGNLDTQASESIMKIFESFNESGKTIMVITHEPDVAKCAGRIVYFRDGRVLHDNSIDGLRRNMHIVENVWRH